MQVKQEDDVDQKQSVFFTAVPTHAPRSTRVFDPVEILTEGLTHSTAKIADKQISELINEFFDLRPGAIIRDLGLRKPIYQKTAAYGHFGRDDIEFPWERTDKAEALKSAAGL